MLLHKDFDRKQYLPALLAAARTGELLRSYKYRTNFVGELDIQLHFLLQPVSIHESSPHFTVDSETWYCLFKQTVLTVHNTF